VYRESIIVTGELRYSFAVKQITIRVIFQASLPSCSFRCYSSWFSKSSLHIQHDVNIYHICCYWRSLSYTCGTPTYIDTRTHIHTYTNIHARKHIHCLIENTNICGLRITNILKEDET